MAGFSCCYNSVISGDPPRVHQFATPVPGSPTVCVRLTTCQVSNAAVGQWEAAVQIEPMWTFKGGHLGNIPRSSPTASQHTETGEVRRQATCFSAPLPNNRTLDMSGAVRGSADMDRVCPGIDGGDQSLLAVSPLMPCSRSVGRTRFPFVWLDVRQDCADTYLNHERGLKDQFYFISTDLIMLHCNPCPR